MPRFRYSSAVPVLAAVLSCAPLFSAAATDRGPYSIKSGVRTVVLSYASYDPDTCYFAAIPVLRLIKAPANGSVEIGKFAHKASDGPCEGKTFRSSAVAYRSKPGFHGRDEMVVEASVDIYTYAAGTRSDQVRITVDVK